MINLFVDRYPNLSLETSSITECQRCIYIFIMYEEVKCNKRIMYMLFILYIIYMLFMYVNVSYIYYIVCICIITKKK